MGKVPPRRRFRAGTRSCEALSIDGRWPGAGVRAGASGIDQYEGEKHAYQVNTIAALAAVAMAGMVAIPATVAGAAASKIWVSNTAVRRSVGRG